MAWPRLSRTLVAAVALAFVSLGLALWAGGLARDNRRLGAELRAARRGARPALPPPARAGAPEDLQKENARLRRELEMAMVPQANVPALTLSTGSGAEAVLAEETAALLLLRPPAAPAPHRYRLRVLAHDGTMVWEGSGLRRGGGGEVSVMWPAGLAQPGRYRLELFGPAPTDRRVAAFQLTVQPAAEAE